MPMILICPACGQKTQSADGTADSMAFCPRCRVELTPAQETQAMPAPVPPMPRNVVVEVQATQSPPAPQHRQAMPEHIPQVIPVVRHALPISTGRVASRREPDFDEYGRGRVAPRPAPLDWLGHVFRWGNPSLKVLILMLLPFPFVEVCCAPATFGPTPGSVLVSQSWVQSLWGSYSEYPDFDPTIREMKFANAPNFSSAQLKRETIPPALPMWLVLGLLLGGVILGIVVPLGTLRSSLLGSCALLLLLAMIIQLGMGFPLEKAVAKEKAEILRIDRPDLQPSQAAMIHTRYTPWFMFWVFLLLCSMAGVVAEIVCVQGFRGKLIPPKRLVSDEWH